MDAPPVIPLETYAEISARVAAAPEHQLSILAAHALTEHDFEAAAEYWEAELEKAATQHGDQDGVPPLLIQYAEAFARAQRQDTDVSLERFAAIVRGLSRGAQLGSLLTEHGLALGQFMDAQRHWTARLSKDAALAERFSQLLNG